MRSFRSTTALLALLVTAWSNVTALQCGAERPAAGDVPAEGTHAPHHGASGHEPTEHDEGSLGEAGGECGLVMACGAAARGAVALATRAPAPPLPGDAPRVS